MQSSLVIDLVFGLNVPVPQLLQALAAALLLYFPFSQSVQELSS
jgi:hypothetical protein